MRIGRRFFLFIGVLLLLAGAARSAYLVNVPQELRQPDGGILHCLASGDEYYNWLHDADGYTIVQHPKTGWFVFAEPDPKGDIRPSASVAGRSDPRKAGLAKGLRLAPQRIRDLRRNAFRLPEGLDTVQAPRTGTLNNLAVFIRFQGESEFPDATSVYTTQLNASETGVNSMVNYFREASYSSLSITTSLYPAPAATIISYQDSHARGYFQPYNETTNTIGYTGGNDGIVRRDREHTLLANAVAAVASQVPAGLVVDGDADGRVDNVTFIVSGSTTAWSTLLWPHMWSLYSQTVYINGKRVWTYNFQIRNSLDVGVLCHEMFHSLGSPDLYHYTSNGIAPVGGWDIMQNDANPPQHMGAYMKWRYGGWIASIPEITASGTYTLQPLTSASNNCYKIRSPNSATEYFVVEYRRKTGTFESSLPGEGLLVYRINPAVSGNAYGPPDEVYVYRPDGTLSVNGTVNNAAFSSGLGRRTINDMTNPSSFLSSGGPGGLNISSVGAVGSTISFYVTDPSDSPVISLSDREFSFGATQNGNATPAGKTILTNSGEGALVWTAARSADWISVSPTSGTGDSALTIGIARTDLSPGTYAGTISVTAAGALNNPQTINVTCTVFSPGSDALPFGFIEAPADGTTVRSSIAVTGWALDDIGMQSVAIKRRPINEFEATGPDGLIFIGNATFVRGARNDVAAVYPQYPLADRAGWGYMLLTNFLPNQGNGTFTLVAVAEDTSGHKIWIPDASGRSEIVIHVDNAHALLPFGAIDTPAQGGTASGVGYFNFGWALTPQPNFIPIDGSTIWVWLDGAPLGHPNYGYPRGDIQALFPGYQNTDTAVGVFTLNTAAYTDGVHNIAWSVQDSAGNTDGIGSRFFVIQNIAGEAAAVETSIPMKAGGSGATDLKALSERPIVTIEEFREDLRTPVFVRRGMDFDAPAETVLPETDGSVKIVIPEITRVAIYLNEADSNEREDAMIERGGRILKRPQGEPEARYEAFQLVFGRLQPLPIGASFDSRDGVLYWHPGPGFLGEFEFVLVDALTKTKKTVKVVIR